MIRATRHFSMPNKLIFFILFLIPPLFRLIFVSCLLWLCLIKKRGKVLIKFSAELLKPFPEGDLSALEGAENRGVG